MAAAKINTEFAGPERVASVLGVSRACTKRLIRDAKEYLRQSAASESKNSDYKPPMYLDANGLPQSTASEGKNSAPKPEKRKRA